MLSYKISFAFLTICISSILAFSPSTSRYQTILRATDPISEGVTKSNDNPDDASSSPTEASTIPTKIEKKAPKPKKPAHSEGVFSSLVYVAKELMGEDDLKKFRAQMISKHSAVIKTFVDTYDTPFGQAVLTKAFDLIDKNGDGSIDKSELSEGLKTLGFSWMKEKQIEGIVKRADNNDNGVLEFDEFTKEMPKTLKTNLLKLAKQNGDDMGLLV